MREIVSSIEQEYLRYKGMAEGVFDQLDEAQVATPLSDNGNSVATLVWHMSGNLKSRFTDFLTEDGEKPWRGREEEFARRQVSIDEMRAKWAEGWSVLLGTVATLTDDDLRRQVTIRRQPLKVHEALHRSLAHVALHVGQMILIGKTLKGEGWRYLSIPPGQSDAYNLNPTMEKPTKS
ncbi:MAG TPA: DUF1572 family protein [Longimicrobiales bacterium]|nr:DUF1572 family protein [Longimicrobiales bacterium]